jgi:hypothetical protein
MSILAGLLCARICARTANTREQVQPHRHMCSRPRNKSRAERQACILLSVRAHRCVHAVGKITTDDSAHRGRAASSQAHARHITRTHEPWRRTKRLHVCALSLVGVFSSFLPSFLPSCVRANPPLVFARLSSPGCTDMLVLPAQVALGAMDPSDLPACGTVAFFCACVLVSLCLLKLRVRTCRSEPVNTINVTS